MSFPLYIVSKGRYEYMMTSKVLARMGVAHNIVVEPQEVEAYQAAIDSLGLPTTVVPLDMSFKTKYELCDDLGLTKSTGSGPARNYAWEHSLQQGFSHHWVMDDNITRFVRFNQNEKVICHAPGFFKAMEDFSLRYENVAMSGPNYDEFVLARQTMKPFIHNSRIYSCNFIRNDVPFRWRGRYNEDTILSLDLLKAGWCTILFNAFLQDKAPTQALKGGNTEELYAGNEKREGEKYSRHGTIEKSQILITTHPDVSTINYKFSRVHHVVDYSRFKKNKLIRRKDVGIPDGVNNYGMALKIAEPTK